MDETPARAQWRRRLRWLAVFFGTAGLLLQSCATVQVRHAQRERAHLGDRLYVVSLGTGEETIVFIPGLMGSTAYWRGSEFSKTAGKRQLFVDPLGFGRSPWPDDIDYSLRDQLAALRRTLVHERATRHVTLIAHSFGTLLALHYAAQFPDEVKAVVLLGAPLYRDAAEARRHIGTMSPLAGLLVRNRIGARVVCTFHNAFMPIAGRLAPHVKPELPAEVAHDAVLHFWPSLDGSVRNVVLSGSNLEPLRSVGPRTTFVMGSRDTVSDIAFIEQIARESGARFIRTTDDHSTYWRTFIPETLDTRANGRSSR